MWKEYPSSQFDVIDRIGEGLELDEFFGWWLIFLDEEAQS